MFSMCSEHTPRAPIPDTRIPQLMQPWRATHKRSLEKELATTLKLATKEITDDLRESLSKHE